MNNVAKLEQALQRATKREAGRARLSWERYAPDTHTPINTLRHAIQWQIEQVRQMEAEPTIKRVA